MKRCKTFVLATSLVVLGALSAVTAFAGGAPKVDLTTPAISCFSATASSITLQVCGTGTAGAPLGFSIHMKTKAEYDADWAANPGAGENRGWNATASYRCWSFGGNCGGPGFESPWVLTGPECTFVTISADFLTQYMDVPNVMCGASQGCGQAVLTCGTEYVFRVFAHGGGNYTISPKGPVPALVCATEACPPPDGGCTYTWGYWKTHGPEGCSPGNQIDDWDVASLNIGSLTLDQTQLCDIFHTNPSSCAKGAGANAVIILEHQLIAAMLNVANGAISCPFANAAIVSANNLLSGYEYGCVGTNSTLGQQMLGVKDLLEAYNSDICDCPVQSTKPQASPGATTSTTKTTWGNLKSIYR